jgi:hypothetical protein
VFTASIYAVVAVIIAAKDSCIFSLLLPRICRKFTVTITANIAATLSVSLEQTLVHILPRPFLRSYRDICRDLFYVVTATFAATIATIVAEPISVNLPRVFTQLLPQLLPRRIRAITATNLINCHLS